MTRTGRPRTVPGELRRPLGVSLGESEIRALHDLSQRLGESQGAIVGRLVIEALDRERGKKPPVTDTFDAFVQYHDWEGEAAADDADVMATSIDTEFRNRNLLHEDEQIVGVRSNIGENLVQVGVAPVSVTALIVPRMDPVRTSRYLETDPVRAREARLELSIDEWMLHFKRFSIVLAPKHLEARVVGKQYEIVESFDR